jgi:hypothetical protein
MPPKKKSQVRESKPLAETYVPTGDGDSVLVRGSGKSSYSMRPAKNWNLAPKEYRKKYGQAMRHADKKLGERKRSELLKRHYKATGTKPKTQKIKEKYNRFGGSFTSEM